MKKMTIMPQILDILSKEQERDSEEKRSVIHLYQEGTFYRAYEWSAWLCHRFIKQFKVTHRKMKNVEQTVCFIGFPLTSLSTHTPSGAEIVPQEDKALDIILPREIVPDEMTLDIMSSDFETWKDAQPITEPNQKKAGDSQTQAATPFDVHSGNTSPSTITGIMQQIISFPLENRTPLQCMAFIAETKTKLSKLI